MVVVVVVVVGGGGGGRGRGGGGVVVYCDDDDDDACDEQGLQDADSAPVRRVVMYRSTPVYVPREGFNASILDTWVDSGASASKGPATPATPTSRARSGAGSSAV